MKIIKFLILLIFSIYFSNIAIANETPKSLCKRLIEVRLIPFKGETVNDPVYNEFIKMGNKAIPCLIRNLTNASLMLDPRKMAAYKKFAVGDLALFVLNRITDREILDILPMPYSEKYRTEGVHAYFEYVGERNSRSHIQNNWKNWYKNNVNKKN